MVHRRVPGKTQRDKIIEAVEVLRLLLGQGVCSQVEDLIQEHILPPPKVTPPHSPAELERAQQLATLLGEKAMLDKSIRKGLASVWAPASQDTSHVGHAGVGVVSLRSAPLSLPTFAAVQCERLFDCGRAVRCMLPLGCGRFFALSGAVWLSGC